ncbi:hypothetical protein [Rhizobium indicum]|uniref:Uncharacterized protein n=1 Tax=Rhizobium indicum TaxID=2583231 RepID=A0ABX6PPH5_9HYPH|nr:hypothetical protein [Rhizobium indicum]QKK20529.1 hypothetical protein FFM53_029630 [Rhizobium indicum]
MQIIGTSVTNISNGKVTVEFTGEGGEGISVTVVSSTGDLDGDAAVRRANELMVQVATFGIPNEAFVEAQQAADESVVETDDGAEETSPATGFFSSPKAVS